jgi:hypothetical protein
MLPCLKSGIEPCSGDVCPAHLSKLTDACKGKKASPWFVSPLCHWHHTEQHRVGEVTFWRGIDNIYKLKEWQLKLYHAKDIFEAQRIVNEARKDLFL